MPYRAGSVTTAGDSSGTTLVITRPAGAAADDILEVLLYLELLGKTVSGSPGTWTLIPAASGEQTNGTSFARHVMQSRQGAESGNITFSWDGTSGFRVGIAAAYTGRFTTGDASDGTATYNESTSAGTTVTCLGITTGNANADLVAFASMADAAANYAWSVLTERAEIGQQAIADVVQAGAGASGNKTATCGSANWSSGLIALREAAGAAAGIVARTVLLQQAANRASTY